MRARTRMAAAAMAVGALLTGTTALIGCSASDPLDSSATLITTIQEDDPGWDCRVHGDLTCGPTNAQGVAAGLYRDGELFATWEELR